MNNARSYTVAELVKNNIIEKPYDGNHGAVHPKGKDFIDSGIPFIMASDVENAKIDLIKCKFISKKQADSLRKGFAIEGDVLLTHKASIGRTAIVPPLEYPYIMLTPQVTYYRIKNKKILNNHYLKYYFDSKPFQEVLGAMAGSGSTRAYLGIIGQQDLPVVIPEISSQQKIAAVLTALDAKIELNQHINAELESMAKTLYNYWFVQFNFPDEKGKPHKSSGGEMVWNEVLKREVPEGWEVEILDNVVNTILDHRGKTPLKLGGNWAKRGEGVIALSAKHVKDGKLVKLDDANIVGFEMFEKWMTEKLKEGDILMTSEAPLGEFYLILNDTDYCMSQRLFAIRADNSKVLSTYLYYELSKGNGFSQIIGKASGSTVFGIRQDELRKVNILKPKFNLQKMFDEIVKPMLFQIRNNEFQNQKLTALRDWLLPMLMNGQVKINFNDNFKIKNSDST